MVDKVKTESERVNQQAQMASTPVDLAHLGLESVAYIRRAVIDNQQVWSIHNAAGAPVGAAHTREQALAAIMQHDLQPLHVN
jgi:hypothetical protein